MLCNLNDVDDLYTLLASYFVAKRPSSNQAPRFKGLANRCTGEPRSCDSYAEFPGLGNELAEHVVCIPAVWRRGWAALSLARSSYRPSESLASLCLRPGGFGSRVFHVS
jgi:hypothetical protein